MPVRTVYAKVSIMELEANNIAHRVADVADRVTRCEPGETTCKARTEVDEACRERVWRPRVHCK
jgi:hypothetical protein